MSKVRERLRAIPPCELPRRGMLYDLTAKVFFHRRPAAWLRYCRGGYFEGGDYDWQASVVGLLGDEAVTHYGVWDVTMRIGTARVRVGGVGAVATHPRRRKRGLMAVTALDSLRRMEDRGYDMTLLFGIPSFYHRFGYVSAYPSNDYVADVERLPSGGPPAGLARFSPGTRRDLDGLYNRQHARLTGTVVRPTFRQNRDPRDWRGYLWPGKGRRPAGYVVAGVRRGKLCLFDAAGDPEQILRAMRRLTERAGHRKVYFPLLHWRSPLAMRLREGFCRIELRYSRSGGAMIQTLNLASTLRKMRGELWRRLKDSRLAGWRGELLIADARQEVALKIGPRAISLGGCGRSRHSIRGGRHLTQLLIGTDEPGEVIRAGLIRTAGDGRKLAEALFPAQHPMLSRWDIM
ncbi:MAG TPA: GNAT family N-acetyltransferase [Phycisphaerae bacterium]|nr:GNAT family N-acetyltransferase [Phycisphaerae bacterium]